jgi:hypothetical protein
VQIELPLARIPSAAYEQAAQTFLAAIQEEYFRRQYFYAVPIETIQQVLSTTVQPTSDR